jgi:aryl-alcohol dehydrogenase-like predicted oxidoreductase
MDKAINEAVVARAIEHRRDQAFLSVKFGVLRGPSGSFLGLDVRPNSVMNFAAYSLQRLDVDVIDLYQPGRIDPTVPIEDTVGAIADLIQEGKVRYLGLSEVRNTCAGPTASIPWPRLKSSILWPPG